LIDYNSPAIVWFRNDLRISENLALQAAVKHVAVIPVFIWAPDEEKPWAPGEASRWWLHRSLGELDKSLKAKESQLFIDTDNSLVALQKIIEATGAKSVYWNRRYEPAIIERDKKLEKCLIGAGLYIETFNSSLLNDPWEVLKKDGSPYRVYTAYWNVARTKVDLSKKKVRFQIPIPPKGLRSYKSISDLNLCPKISWDQGFKDSWRPGEEQAKKNLAKFLRTRISSYDKDRDIPSLTGTSLLSPHLHFGEIGPKQIWAAIIKKTNKNLNSQQYLKELVWRDFAAQLLYHFPHTDKDPLRDAFKKFPWKRSKKNLKAWQTGMTGYPIVDAGMRQLWTIGWMHNRVRMIVASFLIKDFQIRWQEGAEWFWDTLVDADLASNTMGWQWTAGCGADAAPYFRVFNPMLQGTRFDPEGRYIRKWVPELKALPTKWIHSPWDAPQEELKKAGVILGRTYPKPTVDHFEAKMEALFAYDAIKTKK